jgi:hypothetical protein
VCAHPHGCVAMSLLIAHLKDDNLKQFKACGSKNAYTNFYFIEFTFHLEVLFTNGMELKKLNHKIFKNIWKIKKI